MADNSIITKVTGTDGSSNRIASTFYGTCDTAANTAQKDVTLADSCVFSLVIGATVHVKFTNSNTHATPTLKVGNSAAKSIRIYGSTSPGTTMTSSWYAGAVVSFTYDGAGWLMNDYKTDTDTNTWRAIKLNGTQILGSSTDTNALNLASGTEISLTNSSGTVTIDATTHTTVDGTTLEISRTASASPTMANVINAIYPVGSYFHSSVHTNPQTWLTGTTWEEVTNTLVAKPDFSNVIKSSTSYSNGATYTATQDCFVWYVSNPSGSAVGGMSTHQSGMSSGTYVFEDYMYAVNVVSQFQHCSFVKKGETVKLASPYQNQTYAVYGVDNKINGINTYLYHRTA